MSKKENSEGCSFSDKVVFFATGNIHKFNEVRDILSPLGFAVGMLRVKGDEMQSDSLREIAMATVTHAFKVSHLPIFVEDAGLFIHALNGFPGPYAAYVFKTIHNAGVLKLMDGVKSREAKFHSVIAYCDETLGEPQFFDGESDGTIILTERNSRGKTAFGFDPIFQPAGSSKSFSEMSVEVKNCFSHRSKAIRKFAEWYQKTKMNQPIVSER
jgi:XTP/dITP diphosphohydrolase